MIAVTTKAFPHPTPRKVWAASCDYGRSANICLRTKTSIRAAEVRLRAH